MRKDWVIKRIDVRVQDPKFITIEHIKEIQDKGGPDYYYAGKHKQGSMGSPMRDMFAAFNTVNADKIQRYSNHASAMIDLQEIKEPGRYVIEPHFVIEK